MNEKKKQLIKELSDAIEDLFDYALEAPDDPPNEGYVGFGEPRTRKQYLLGRLDKALFDLVESLE